MKLTNLKFLGIAILLNSVAVIARGDALDNWTTGQINTNVHYGASFEMASVTYGNGRYVAVGSYGGSDFGVIETSEDGVNWTVRGDGPYYNPPLFVLDLYKITYGNGTFVAVGDDVYGVYGNLYNSTNGITWTSHTNATVSDFNGVTYGGGLFVAVGDGRIPNCCNPSITTTNRQIYTSPDGITWTGRNSGAPANAVHTIYDVAYGAGRFVAVDGQGFLYSSTTGSSWGRSANSSAGFTISYCNNRFILSSGPGTNQISADGLTWSVLTNNTASTFGGVIYTNGFYVALSGSNIFTSTDVTNWIQRNFPANYWLNDIALGPRNVIALGEQSQPGMPNSAPKAYVSDPFVAVSLHSGLPPQLAISGLQSHSYRIDYLDGLQSGANNWQTLTTFSLTNSPLLWSDTTATNAQRFYRAVLLP